MQILFFPRKQPRENFFLETNCNCCGTSIFLSQGVNYLLFFMLLGLNHQIWGVLLLRFTAMSNVCVRVCVCIIAII